jgi:serine/threonine protein kinase
LDWAHRIRLAIEITSGAVYLHDRHPQVLHRDIKSLNVLIDNTSLEAGHAKLCDFGLAKELLLSGGSSGGAARGTMLWMAPELFADDTRVPYSQASDVYGLAVVFVELCTHQTPFAGLGGVHQAPNWVLNQGRRPLGQRQLVDGGTWEAGKAWPHDIPALFREVVEAAWAQLPSDRLTALECLVRLRAAADGLHDEEEPFVGQTVDEVHGAVGQVG